MLGYQPYYWQTRFWETLSCNQQICHIQLWVKQTDQVELASAVIYCCTDFIYSSKSWWLYPVSSLLPMPGCSWVYGGLWSLGSRVSTSPHISPPWPLDPRFSTCVNLAFSFGGGGDLYLWAVSFFLPSSCYVFLCSWFWKQKRWGRLYIICIRALFCQDLEF